MGKLDGKAAVITGSGRGIGKAIALLFAREGAAVVVNDIDLAPAEEAVKEIEAAGGKAVACVADITRGEEAQKLMETAGQSFGRLDILVNNAGITRDNLLNRMTDAQWDLCININLKGTFNCIRAVAPYMMKEGQAGKIVNVTSLSALMGNPGQANYGAAKAGIIGLTKTVAREWSRFGVNCNAVAFGFVETRLTAAKEGGEEVDGEKLGIPGRIREGMLQQMSGKILNPEDAARPVLFLASSDADFINGHVLNVTAGVYM
jgi:3-oxoacyl-[acyl-carrier protein] reductase